MVKNNSILERGDIVWVDFNPTKGREQSGLCPAVVVSPGAYNSMSGMAIICPMASKSKGFLFEVEVVGPKGKSFVLTDQFRSVDIKERIEKQSGKVSEYEMSEILAKISVLLQ